jgi:sec-independent protein translocase protein TatA
MSITCYSHDWLLNNHVIILTKEQVQAFVQGRSQSMPFRIGALELTLIMVIVAMLFGVGKLPEVFGAVGKGLREFRKEANGTESASTIDKDEQAAKTNEERQ